MVEAVIGSQKPFKLIGFASEELGSSREDFLRNKKAYSTNWPSIPKGSKWNELANSGNKPY